MTDAIAHPAPDGRTGLLLLPRESARAQLTYARRLIQLSRAAGALVAALGVLVLVGWALDVEVLKHVIPGAVSMKANAAAAFVLAGGALAVLASPPRQGVVRVAQGVAVGVALIGGLTLSQYLLGVDLGFDQLLFREEIVAPETSHPGRMAPLSALNLLLLGVGLTALPSRRGARIAQALALVTLVFALVVLVGYGYRMEPLYGLGRYTDMAVHGSAAFLLLSLGVLFARPTLSGMARFTSERAAGVLVRRLLPAVLFTPLILGGLISAGEVAAWYGPTLSASLQAVSTMLVLAGVTWMAAGVVEKGDRALVESQERLREAVEARDEFLRVASHELRTPLAALFLQTEVLRRRSAQPDGIDADKLCSQVDLVDRQAARLTALVDDLLDVSRISGGGLTIKPARGDLAATVRRAVERLEPSARRAGSTIILEAPGRLEGELDEARVEQVLENLLSNAIKYGARAPIEVRVARGPHREARVEVRDHGPGIPEADRARIFERFERAAPSTHYGGLGLGLWIARHIVERHGGRLEAGSAEGGGSVFRVTLPLKYDVA